MKSVCPGKCLRKLNKNCTEKYLRKEKFCPDKDLRKYNGNDFFG
jgi:hypothetical protein